jgi:hypothetical protein
MKEITGSSMNIYYIKHDGKFEPNIEGILIVSEPIYRVDAAGQLIRERTTETIRFSTSLDGIKSLAAQFLQWAETAENETQ